MSAARGIVYLRLSRALGDPDDANLKAEMLAAHRAALLRLAAEDRITVAEADVIEEIGSAEYLRDRPAFRGLVERWEHERWEDAVVYTVAVDRLSRASLSEVGRIMEALVHAGIRVRTPQRFYDLREPDDELFYAFLAALSRHELGRYRQRVKLKWREMTLAGLIVTGGAPYGYRWDKNLRNLVSVEAELAIVRELFALAPLLSTYQLGRRFGLAPGRVWSILRNPVYTGWPARHMESHRWREGEGKKGGRLLPVSLWLWPEKPGIYEAAVSREQFLIVQEALAQRERLRLKTNGENGWCRDVVRFEGREEEGVQLSCHHSAAGDYLTYSTRPWMGKRLYVDREIVHGSALAAIGAVFARSDVLSAAQVDREPGRSEAARDQVAAELFALRRRLDQLLARELDERDPEELASLARVRQQTRREIEEKNRSLSVRQPSPSLPADLLALLPEIASQFEPAWDAQGEPARRALARAILSRVVIRITPRRHPLPHLREVCRIDYHPWLAALMPESLPGVE